MKTLKDCDGKKYPYIHLINVTSDLTEDCKLVLRGCFRIKKGASGVDTMEIFYNGKFGKKTDKKDLCEGLKNEKAKKGLEPYSDMKDLECPLKEGIKCFRNGFNLVAEYKNYIGMAAGNHEVKTHIYNSETPKELYCMKCDVEIKKSGGLG